MTRDALVLACATVATVAICGTAVVALDPSTREHAPMLLRYLSPGAIVNGMTLACCAVIVAVAAYAVRQVR